MAFTLLWSEVIIFCPDLNTLSKPQQDIILGDVEGLLSESNLGIKYQIACRYLACHFGTLVKRGIEGHSGTVSQESVGTVSRSYAVGSILHSDLESTVWGVQLSALLNRTKGKVGVVLG